MGYFLAAILGYLLGCSNLAYYLSRAFKRDIRKDGSGNLGASNATVLFGWKAGASVAVHDIGKAVLAVILILVLATIITDYIVIGTFSAIVTVPVYMGFFARNLILMAIVCVASFAIFWKHRENIGRMIRREEIGLRSTMRGDKRYDKQ